jgi:predicted nucleotidyltransferase
MVKRQDIRLFVKQVVAEFRPRRVILFGSYAYGKPTPDSDVDLLVVMPHEGHPAIQAAEIRRRVRARFPMDLVVRSPREIRRRLAQGDAFIAEIMERGQELYEARHARVG